MRTRRLLTKPSLSEIREARPWLHPLMEGCELHYPFIEGAGQSTRDFSGFGRNANLSNMAENDWILDGQFGTALNFDGSNDFINAGPVGNWGANLNGRWTVAFWVRTTVSNTLSIPVGARETNPLWQIGIERDSGNSIEIFQWASDSTNRQWVSVAEAVNNGSWHHVVAIRRGSSATTLEIWRNGIKLSTTIQDNQTLGTSSNFTSGIGVGARLLEGSVNTPFPGDLDMVMFWSRALSSEEIQSLYGNTLRIYRQKPRTFFVPISGTQNISPTGISTSSSIGSHSLLQEAFLVPSGISTSSAIGSHSLLQERFLVPSGISTSSVVGGHTLTQSQAITPSGVSTSSVVGGHTVVPGGVSIAPTGITSAAVFGSHVIALFGTITPAGLTSSAAFGTHTVTPGGVSLLPSGILTATQIGTAIITAVSELLPTGVGSSAVIGNSVIAGGPITITVTGISTGTGIGTVTVLIAGQETMFYVDFTIRLEQTEDIVIELK